MSVCRCHLSRVTAVRFRIAAVAERTLGKEFNIIAWILLRFLPKVF